MTESETLPPSTTATILGKHSTVSSANSDDPTVHGDGGEVASTKSRTEGGLEKHDPHGGDDLEDNKNGMRKDKDGRDVNANGLTQEEVDSGILTGWKLFCGMWFRHLGIAFLSFG